jgi:hypothetical protein
MQTEYFPSNYFGVEYWGKSYWGKYGAPGSLPAGNDPFYFAKSYFGVHYFDPNYWGSYGSVTPPTPPPTVTQVGGYMQPRHRKPASTTKLSPQLLLALKTYLEYKLGENETD